MNNDLRNYIKKIKIIPIFSVFYFIFIYLFLLSRVISRGIGHDEYQFIASAQLFRNNLSLPYIDYPFLHMPYMPVFYGIFLFASELDLLTLRVVNSIFTLLSTVIIFGSVLDFFRKHSIIFRLISGSLAVLFFILNPAFIQMDGYVLNHSLPILLSLFLYYFIIKGDSFDTRNHLLISAGIISGLAMGIRLNYAVIVFPYILFILLDIRYSKVKERIWSVVKFCLGIATALFPAGILFLLAPKQFIYGNYVYIKLNTRYRQSLWYTTAMTLPDKFTFFIEKVLVDPATLILYLGCFSIFIYGLYRWIRKKDMPGLQLLLLFSISLVLLATGFAPTPSWLQYFFAPIPFMILGFFKGVSIVSEKFIKPAWLLILLLAGLLAINPGIKDLSKQLPLISKPDLWLPIRFQAFSQEIFLQSNCQNSKCKILTLVPIIPLEADADTYPMFTVGPFSWRTAQFLSKEKREEYHVISEKDLASFLADDPPDAILTGTEARYDSFSMYDTGKLDQPFVDYAKANDYRPIPIPDTLNGSKDIFTLYIK